MISGSRIFELDPEDYLYNMLLCYLVAKLCLTRLPPPWNVAHQVPLSMKFPREEYSSGLPFPFPGDLADPGIKPTSPALAVRFFPTEPPGKPINYIMDIYK